MSNSHTCPCFLPAALVFAGLSGLAAVGMGAIAAHALTDAVAVSRVEKASAFQFYHSFALIAVAVLNDIRPHRVWRIAGMLFALGILAFCGSLYLAAFGVIGSASAVAPMGGIALMLGWVAMAASGFMVRRSK